MVSAPIWAVLALLQSWLLASPGEDVRPQDALWSVRPPERRAPYRVSAPRRHGRNEIPALTLELGVLEFGAPLAVAPIRTEGLTLCGPDWSRFGHWRELQPTTIRLPLPSSWTPRTPTETASTFRERDVDTYLGELRWRQPASLWGRPPVDGADPGANPEMSIFEWDLQEEEDRLRIDGRFEDGTVTWSRYIDDDPQRAFIRETLHSMGLPDGIYWNKAVFLPTAGFGNTTYWFGVSMSLRW